MLSGVSKKFGRFIHHAAATLKATTAKERTLSVAGFTTFMSLWLAEQNYLGMPLSRTLFLLPFVGALTAVGTLTVLMQYKINQHWKALLAGEKPLTEPDPETLAQIRAELTLHVPMVHADPEELRKAMAGLLEEYKVQAAAPDSPAQPLVTRLRSRSSKTEEEKALLEKEDEKGNKFKKI